MRNFGSWRKRWPGAASAAEFYRLMMADVCDVVTVVDRKLIRHYVSPSYERVIGYREEDLIGKSVLEHVHPEDRPRVRRILETGVPERGRFHVRVEHANGSWRMLSVLIRNRIDDDAVKGIVLTAYDETRLREVEARLQRSQSLELLGRLSAGAFHDLMNLFTAVMGNLDEVSSSQLPIDSRHALNEAADAVGRAARLARRTVNLARNRRSHEELVNVKELIVGLGPLIERLVGRSVAVALELDDGLFSIRANASDIEQIILNLVMNAHDAMPDGGRLTITASNGTEGSKRVCLRISDTGIGIETGNLSRIFEPFFTTKLEQGGTGIGLATVASIVHRYGGDVTVQSEPGRGTTFTVSLPPEQRIVSHNY